ncbi:MAG: T9SS type A sorting domain-containing protein [Ignavibacteria bacterium]|nr:T9SS type A sorting domain-containing protein [Ignavibacteria bacterium]
MNAQTYVSRAADNAGNYSTWANGNNLGTGFNAWVFTNTGTSGQFLGSAYATSIDVGGKSFGVYGNPAGSNVGKAKRTFTFLKENEKFTFKMSTRFRNGNKGVDILSGSTVLFNINIGGDQYSYQNKNGGSVVNMDATYDGNMAFTVTLIKKSGNVLNVQIDRSTGTGLSATDFTLSSGTIDGVEFYVANTIAGDDNNLYFNSLDISQPKYTSIADGDWNTASTWGSSTPVANSLIEINSAVTVNSAVSANTSSVTINSTKSLTFGASGSLSVQGNWTNSGTLDMTTGGSVSFGGTSVLTITGTNVFNNVNLGCGVNFGSSSTINGTLALNSGGFVSVNAPTYGSSSTLQYNNDYELASEWYANVASGQGVPQNVVINGGNVYFAIIANVYRQLNGNLTINNGKAFSLSQSSGGDLKIKGNLVNNGTLHTNSRSVDFNGGAAQEISGTGTFNFSYLNAVNNSAVTVNANISVSNNINVNSLSSLDCGSSVITFGSGATVTGSAPLTTGTGTLVFSGSGTVNNSTSTFNNVTIGGGVNLGAGVTINGTLQINPGGFLLTNFPTYGPSSTLKYNSGTIYGRGLEWSSTSGAGYPNHVQISNNTTLNLGNAGTTTARQMAGNLTIDAGSALDMSVSGSVMERPLTVFGNITNGGTLKLGGINGPDAGDLIVKGNFTNNGTFNSNTREVVFDGTSVQTISGTTSPVFTYFALSNPAGVELGVNTTIQNRLRFDEGVLRLTNFNLSLSSGATYSGTPSATQMIVTNGTGMLKFTGTGPSTLLFPIGDETGTAEYSPAQVILNSGTETIGVKVVDGAHPSKGPGALYLTRYWDISRDGNSSINYDLTLNYLDGDVSEPAQESSLVMGKFNGTLWTVLPTTLDATANTLTVSSQTSFSQFTGGEPSALPVELSSFNAKVSAGTVLLDWETKTEMNNYGFEVERKLVNSDWTKIGFVEGYGMSNSPKFYSFKDRPSGTGKISYRLKQIDNDGQFEYSPVVEVLVDNLPNGFVLEQNYPNPFNPETSIRFALKEDTKATLKVYNSLGAEVVVLFDGTAEAGRYYDLKFGGNELASGFYIYKLVAGDYVSVKKMLLMK